jgi:hypothetical protein
VNLGSPGIPQLVRFLNGLTTSAQTSGQWFHHSIKQANFLLAKRIKLKAKSR